MKSQYKQLIEEIDAIEVWYCIAMNIFDLRWIDI